MVLRLHRCGTATYMTLSVRDVPVHAEPEVVFRLPSQIHVPEVSCGSICTSGRKNASEFRITQFAIRSPGDRDTILFPVLFLAAVWETITKLLVHYPGNCSGRSHSIKHMSSTIFSFFDNWNILKPALRTLIVFAVVFIYFQFCRYKDQFPAYKLFPDFFQRSTTDRAEFIFLRKIQILFSTGTPLKRSASVALAFRFFAVFSGRSASRSSAFVASGFCSSSASLKKFNWPEYREFFFRWRCQKVFYGEGLSLLSGYHVPE